MSSQLRYNLKRSLAQFRLFIGLDKEKIFPEFYAQANADVFIVSFPKSGRTWIRLMLGKYLATLAGITVGNLLETYELTNSIQDFTIPIIAVVHDGSSFGGINLKAREMEKNKKRYRHKKVIFIVRDPRDVMVSYYLHCTHRRKVFRGHISDFIRDQHFGIHKLIVFYNSWIAAQKMLKGFLLIKYENVHDHPGHELTKILKFLDISVNDELVKMAVEFATFNNMRDMEERGRFESSRLVPGDKADTESYKVRKGIVGGYFDYLSQEDIDYLNKIINTELSHVFGYRHADCKVFQKET